ncbi:12568_t:CDS:2, partial [Entrophospora sp. SA101]
SSMYNNINNNLNISDNKSIGRPGSSVWNHFTKGEGKSKGKHTATCLFCNKYYPRGTPNELESHLVTTCIQVPSSLKEHYLRVISNKDCDSSDKKRKIEKTLSKQMLNSELATIVVAVENELPSENNNISSSVKNTINEFSFFNQVRSLSFVLKPLKDAIQYLESKNTTIADCFIQIASLASQIKHLSATVDPNFKNYCIDIFNKRWGQFNSKLFILGYFLHPKYRDKYLNHDKIRELMLFAIELWADMGHGKQTSTRLVSQIHLYREKKPPYDLPYDNAISSYTWWNLLSKSAEKLLENEDNEEIEIGNDENNEEIEVDDVESCSTAMPSKLVSILSIKAV